MSSDRFPQNTNPAKELMAALDIKQAHIVSEWAHDRPLISCRFEPQGRYVFAGAEDNTVQRWALADGV